MMGIPFQFDDAFPLSIGFSDGAMVVVGVEVSVGVDVGVAVGAVDEKRLQADIKIPSKKNTVKRCAFLIFRSMVVAEP
jgi:hypothetical protein